MSHSNQEDKPTDDIADQLSAEESQNTEPLLTEIDRITGLLCIIGSLGLGGIIGSFRYIKQHA
ncbi:hypothetical protein HUB97_12480 [Halorubraceae archaeon YAN]|nr:hypothetical protein [Halorubraceae archaeon YAN]